jgi:hypothetical protein
VLAIVDGKTAKTYRFSSFVSINTYKDSFGNKNYLVAGNENFIVSFELESNTINAFDVSCHVTVSYKDMIQTRLNASIKETNTNKEADLPVPVTFIFDKIQTI